MLKQFEVKNIYIGEYGWKPWENTIAYFPFETDQLDATGNYTLTANWTQQTIGYKFNVQCGVTWWEIPWINFIGMWYNTHNEKLYWNYDICACAKHWYIAYNPWHSQSNVQNKIVVFSTSSFTLAASASWMSFDNRHYQAWSYDWSKILLCQDWVVTTFYNGSGYDFWNAFTLNNYWNWWDSSLQWTTFSNVIIENTGWTSQKMIDYYNQTKSNYWL